VDEAALIFSGRRFLPLRPPSVPLQHSGGDDAMTRVDSTGDTGGCCCGSTLEEPAGMLASVCGCWSSGAAGPVASTLVRRRDACALEGAVGPHSAASLARIAEDFRTVRSL